MRHLLLLLIFRLIRLLRPRRAQGGKLPTILILQYASPLGCCVHMTPLPAAIKAAMPGCRLVVATRGLGLAALQHNPCVDHLIETADPMLSAGALWRTATAIRTRMRMHGWKPDWILQDASNRRGTYALLALLLGKSPTAGFANAAELYDRHLEYDSNLSLIDNNLRLASLFGAPQKHREPEVYFTADEAQCVFAKVDALNPRRQPMAAFVMQGSGGQQTAWHDQRFVEVISHADAAGLLPVFIGTAGDAANIERVRGLAGGVGCSVAGQTSIPELAALLCRCDVVVTVDTGSMHVGRASGVPMVVLGPSWQKPLEWLPLGMANVRILRGADRTDVPVGYQLDEIAAVDVIAACDELLRLYPPSEIDRAMRIERRLSTKRA